MSMILVWDTETTGFRSTDEIIEISMVRVPIEHVLDTHFEQLTLRLKPVANTEFPYATKVHGLTYEEHLQHCVTFVEAVPSILSFISQTKRPTIMVAHNNSFDMKMLYNEMAKTDRQLPPGLKFACSLEMFRRSQKMGELNVESCKLGSIYEYVLCRKLEGAHGALSDTLGILHIFQHLKQSRAEFQGEGCPFNRLMAQV